uniref:Tissue factor n=1 Tax=Gadus morhua TaxID=8049 RepID=A0A8C5BSZ1_GADMO
MWKIGAKEALLALSIDILFFTCLVSGEFPRAQNVTWISTNFKTLLTWGPKPSENYSYTVEYSVVGEDRENNPHCIQSRETMCDLSASLSRLRESYIAEVLSEPPRGVALDLVEPPHTRSQAFCPYLDTDIDRPDFTIVVGKDKRSVTLNVMDPLTALFDGNQQQSIRDVFGDELQYRVTYRRHSSTGKVRPWTLVFSTRQLGAKSKVRPWTLVFSTRQLGANSKVRPWTLVFSTRQLGANSKVRPWTLVFSTRQLGAKSKVRPWTLVFSTRQLGAKSKVRPWTLVFSTRQLGANSKVRPWTLVSSTRQLGANSKVRPWTLVSSTRQLGANSKVRPWTLVSSTRQLGARYSPSVLRELCLACWQRPRSHVLARSHGPH